MQARLSMTRFPSLLLALVFALAAALILGGVLGYTLKPAVSVPARTQVVVVPAGAYDPAASDNCIWSNHHKGC